MPDPAEHRPRSASRGGREGERELRLEGVTVQYGGVTAVEDLSLIVPAGRITGLIGPNGAGKTSSFNACTGLVRCRSGRFILSGTDISRLSTAGRARRGLGRTFQRTQLCDSLTVAENVLLGGEARQAGSNPFRQLWASRASYAALRDAQRHAIELCGLSTIAASAVGGLSTGQRRLVELARVIAGDFEILLMDEPSSGLDTEETAKFGEILVALVQERGVGILLVEHDIALVNSVCEYAYILDFGRLIADGPAAEILASEIVRSAYLGEGIEG